MMSVSTWEMVLIGLLAGLFIVLCLVLGLVSALTGFKSTAGSEVCDINSRDRLTCKASRQLARVVPACSLDEFF